MTQCLEVNSSSISVWFMLCSEGLAEDGVLSHILWLRNHASERTLSPRLCNSGSASVLVCFLFSGSSWVRSFDISLTEQLVSVLHMYCTAALCFNWRSVSFSAQIYANIPICKSLGPWITWPDTAFHCAAFFKGVRLGVGHQTALGWSGCHFCSIQTSLPQGHQRRAQGPCCAVSSRRCSWVCSDDLT